MRGEAAAVRAFYDQTADQYDTWITLVERLLFSGGRARTCSAVHGRVLEIAVGTGRNLPFYPPDAHLTGIDSSPAMLALALRRARQLGRQLAVQVADAQALPFGAGSFDAVVSTIALCSVPDERAAIVEAQRALRPGGRFVLMEHVRSSYPLVLSGQRLVEPIARRHAHDHLLRDPLDHLEGVGFVVEQVSHSRLGVVEYLVARRLG